MRIVLNQEQIEKLRTARLERKFTQQELSEDTHVSLRTVQNLESGRRNSFNDDTIVRLCRSLELDYQELMKGTTAPESAPEGTTPPQNSAPLAHPPARKKLARKLIPAAAAVFSMLTLVLILIQADYHKQEQTSNNYERKDWIDESKNRRQIGKKFGKPPDWYMICEYLRLDAHTKCGATVPAELKWIYHFSQEVSRPVTFVSAYCQWEPDKEIRLFDGVIFGHDEKVFNFEIQCPEEPGIYGLRVFFTGAYSPVPSYYGHPPPDQVHYPSAHHYVEITLDVYP